MRGFADFEARTIDTERGSIFVRAGGAGTPLLLLHGFPETGLMWRDTAPLLAGDATVIVADLPGYGASAYPRDPADRDAMSKRAMAQALVEAMRALGHARFAVAGHDRGGRVAYRMALDHPEVIERVAVLDMVPTIEVWERADARTMLAFWPFALLAQPAPFPERLLAAAPEAVVDHALACWGSPPETFPAAIRQAYVDALRDRAHSICEEYRAAADIDRTHDEADRDAGRMIECPLLALWSARGGPAHWYDDAGGVIGIWRRWASSVAGEAIDGGHFFPEEFPGRTAALLRAFLAG
ncbi:alpha/beta hydrolase [Sphingomonas sp.]|uniref:alpha/beta fold hydrolase n=1 Tax=Sphingomonas sp. TaxID=28214 RepID=UPI0031DF05A0